MRESDVNYSPKDTCIVVVGAGYVGLPMALTFAEAGFRSVALDKDETKVGLIQQGKSYISDVSSAEVGKQVELGNLWALTNPAVLNEADVVIVCVPTPLNKTREPDMQYILAAVEEIAQHAHENMLVVLESTTYPGTTSEIVIPKLSAGGLRVGEDFFVAFSPERVDPGNKKFGIVNTPKVIGGATPACLKRAMDLYSQVIEHLVPVTSTVVAETVKLLENTFRAVNIGLVNEVAMMSRKLGIDPYEVIRAAATKPFGFMPFYPGPGLGGHCVPIDPLYLSWKLKSLQYEARFIGLADSINSGMPAYVVQRLADCLNDVKKPVNGSTILVYGVAYKPNTMDVRESPALGVIHELEKRGAIVSFMDPHVLELKEGGLDLLAIDVDSDFANFDAVVITTHHDALPAQRMLKEASLILDTRDALFGVEGDRSKVQGL